MPQLIIDNLEIEVPVGTKVIDAAEQLGIMIPRFCFHPALGPVGACRLCAVKFVEGPLKGVQMSCMADAEDGMVVSTTDEEAVEFRKYVIEWYMQQHPHDCPVCDEGGHCLLQDETVSGGHGIRRYLGEKRTYHDQYLGPFVQHEMNRCIHCFRCRRFYQEFAGYRDLGAMQIGYRMYFGRFSDGTLESPFSGNLIDICPTGVFTDKPARYKGRRWDFERSPSLCLHCSLGCNTITSARYREVMRQEARLNESINGYFICDRGRFGYDYANHPERPRRPRVRGRQQVTWVEGIQAAAEGLTRITQIHGPDAIASLGSTRSSLETQGQLQRFCRLLDWPEPCFFADPSMVGKVTKAVSRLDAKVAVSMREIEGSDLVLGVGSDPINEAPMLAMAMRQAQRNGGTVIMIDPRPLFLPFQFDHLPVGVKDIDPCLSVLIKEALNRSEVEKLGSKALQFFDALPRHSASDPLVGDRVIVLGQKLKKSQKPVIVCGTDIVPETTPSLSADLALLLQSTKERVGLFYTLPGPNAFGAAILSKEGSAQHIIEEIEKGSVKGLVLVECDPFWSFHDHERLSKALGMLDLLLVLDYLPSQSVERADILLPTVTALETIGSSFINQEGRAQFSSPVHEGGLPIQQVSEGSHPPRTFLSAIPGGEPKTAGEIFTDLASVISVPGKEDLAEDIRTWLARQMPVLERLDLAVGQADGVRLIPDESPETVFSLEGVAQQEERVGRAEDQLELLLIDWTFGTEELSSYSRYVHQAERSPQIMMHTDEASRLGLSHGDKVVLHLPGGSLTLDMHSVDNMAKGVAVMPRHRQLDWQKLNRRRMMVPVEDLEKV